MVLSKGKLIPTVIWDSHRVILADYLERENAITSEYYANLLQQFADKIKEKLNFSRLVFTVQLTDLICEVIFLECEDNILN